MQRRSFLRGLSASAVVGASGCRPETDSDVGSSLAAPTVDHLVFVMMENRSFDHYFGSLTLSEGRSDVDGLLPTHSNPDANGQAVAPSRAATHCPLDPPHGWTSSRDQFTDGTNQGFVKAYADRWGVDADPNVVMGFYERDQLPILYALADQHLLCDRWFCSVMGPTWPNRLYSHGAQSEGMFGNDLPDGQLFTMRTVWDQLVAAGVDWRYYYSDGPFLALFSSLVPRHEIQPIERFFVDCAEGTLPAVCQVEPQFSFNDDHPPHHPMLGQIFLASVYQALADSPLWGRVLLVITWDEHGGFHDHVAPPKMADNREQKGFDQVGFRVPALICGPWCPPGIVSDPLDHTSWIRTVQTVHGLGSLTARDAAALDLLPYLDGSTARPPATLPVLELSEEEVLAQCTARRSATEAKSIIDRVPIPARWDRRHLQPELTRWMLDQAVRQGVLRWK